MPPEPSDDAHRWLAALAARVEDDEAVLAAISDDELARLLAAEDVRASGVEAAIRRRVREASASPTAMRPRWRWVSGVVIVCLVGLVWLAWPSSPPDREAVLRHRAELVAFAGPPTKGEAPPPLARGARDLLAAAEREPPDRVLAAEAARTLAGVATAEPARARRAAAAYFAGLAFRLASDEEEARYWLRRVPAGSEYADAAADALVSGGP